MVQRLSTLFVRTLRDNPADAEVPSHRLLVRAGYIRRAAPGGYTWLPLGFRVFQNVARVIREEMDAIGAQEVNFPAMLPKEPYEVTGRWTDYGDNLFRLQDRRKVDFLLGPTHEEMFTLLVKDLYSSYKDLPVWLYQIQNKFRDEARPRGGLLRGREFSMKDSYSFDLDQEGLQRSYDAHRNAYIRIFERLGLPFAIVSAMSGAMGGSASEEFLFPCDIGEDTFVRCTTCGYAANTEAVTVPTPAAIDFSNENVLIIDAGTCITYDFKNSKNEYLGGGISPGIQMRFKSLNSETSNLPLSTINHDNKLIGDDTDSSIKSGIVNGVVSEIDGIINQYQERFKNIRIILTGGDSNFLLKKIKNTIFADQNFLLKGLNYLLEDNIK